MSIKFNIINWFQFDSTSEALFFYQLNVCNNFVNDLK